jgi:hypothetical protein
MEYKQEIEKLKHGESFIVPESDYGKAEVYRINDVFVVFSIPLFGGQPFYDETFGIARIDEMIEHIESHT